MKRIIYYSLLAFLFSITINPRPSGGSGRSGGNSGSTVIDPSSNPTPTPVIPTPVVPISPQTQASIADWINNNKAAFISVGIGVTAAVGMVVDLLLAKYTRGKKGFKDAYTIRAGKKVLDFPRDIANSFNDELTDANYRNTDKNNRTFKNKLKAAIVRTFNVSDDKVRYDKKQSVKDQEEKLATELEALKETIKNTNESNSNLNFDDIRNLDKFKNASDDLKKTKEYKAIQSAKTDELFNNSLIQKKHFTEESL